MTVIGTGVTYYDANSVAREGVIIGVEGSRARICARGPASGRRARTPHEDSVREIGEAFEIITAALSIAADLSNPSANSWVPSTAAAGLFAWVRVGADGSVVASGGVGCDVTRESAGVYTLVFDSAYPIAGVSLSAVQEDGIAGVANFSGGSEMPPFDTLEVSTYHITTGAFAAADMGFILVINAES